MSDHAVFSPSASERWLNCYGSINLCNKLLKEGKITEDETSPWLIEGQWGHDIAAECIRRSITPLNIINRIYQDEEITVQDARALSIYYNICQDRKQKRRWYVETKITVTDDVWGTSDFFSFDENILDVIDLKYGKGVIKEVIDNSQLLIYAYGILKQLEKKGVQPKEICLWIIQPRIPDKPVKNWTVSPEYIYKWASEVLFKGVIQIKKGDISLNPGPIQCRFCPARKHCARSKEVAFQFFEEYAVNHTDPRIIPVDKLLHILNNKELILQGIKQVTEYAEEILKKGGEVPGWTLKNGRSNRRWGATSDKIEKALLPVIDEDVLYSKKLMSPAGVEAILGKKHPLWPIIEKMITKPPGKPKLVQEDSPGKSIITATQHFDNFLKGEK